MSDAQLRELERAFMEQGTEDAAERLVRARCRASGRKLVRTVAPLHGTGGFLIAEKHIEARRPGAWGELGSWVGGHGGDVWWVRHADMTAAAYSTCEFVDENGERLIDE